MNTMKTVVDILGVAILVLCGLAIVVGLVALLLWEIRIIVCHSREITSHTERSDLFFPDVPTQRGVNDYWQN